MLGSSFAASIAAGPGWLPKCLAVFPPGNSSWDRLAQVARGAAAGGGPFASRARQARVDVMAGLRDKPSFTGSACQQTPPQQVWANTCQICPFTTELGYCLPQPFRSLLQPALEPIVPSFSLALDRCRAGPGKGAVWLGWLLSTCGFGILLGGVAAMQQVGRHAFKVAR